MLTDDRFNRMALMTDDRFNRMAMLTDDPLESGLGRSHRPHGSRIQFSSIQYGTRVADGTVCVADGTVRVADGTVRVADGTVPNRRLAARSVLHGVVMWMPYRIWLLTYCAVSVPVPD